MTDFTNKTVKAEREALATAESVLPLRQKKRSPIALRHNGDLKLKPESTSNHLLALLPRKDRMRLAALCDTVELTLGEVLAESGTTTSFVYFPINSFVSLIAQTDGRLGLEVGMVGRELRWN